MRSASRPRSLAEYTHICQANHVYGAEVYLQKDLVRENVLREIYTQDIWNHVKANANATILAAKVNVILESKNLPTVAQTGLLDNGIDICFAIGEKPTEHVWFNSRFKTRADTSGLQSDTRTIR
jgi:hypothetical protein